MKIFQTALLIFVFILFSCGNNKQVTEEKNIPKIDSVKQTATQKKKPEKKILKAWDSLNHNNVRPFFEKYGKLNKENKVLIRTKFGTIKLRLFNETPLHRASFIFLVKIGYFNTTVFHRIAKDMAIQGGESDEQESATFRNKYQNYKLPAEFLKHKKHRYGALALARRIDFNPNKLSNPFNFYIVSNKGGAHHLDGDYTVFGEVISGFSTIKKISKVKTGISDWPITDIPIEMEIIK